MKIKVLKFPDGKVAITTGLKVEVNKQKHILEEDIELSKKDARKLMEKPKKFKFKKKVSKKNIDSAIITKRD